VKFQTSRWARSVALLAFAGIVGSCGLPRVGPNKSEIFSGSVQKKGDAFVVSVNDRVTRATAVVPALGVFAGIHQCRPGRLGHDPPGRHAGADDI